MWFRSDLTVSTSNLKAGDWDESDGMNSLCISIASGHEQIGTWLQFGHSGILGVSAIPYGNVWSVVIARQDGKQSIRMSQRKKRLGQALLLSGNSRTDFDLPKDGEPNRRYRKMEGQCVGKSDLFGSERVKW